MFSFFELFYRIFRKSTSLCGPTSSDSRLTQMAYCKGPTISVHLDSHHAISIPTNLHWNVGTLKEEILRKHGTGTGGSIRIIFQGKELNDSITIEECDFDNHTVIHAVKGRSRRRASPRNQGFNAISEVTDDSHCKSIQPGKLRVRCLNCKQGTLTVERDPNEWSDVLIPGRIFGCCEASSCNGDTAEFYFKSQNHESEENDSAVALNQIKTNIDGRPCITCFESLNPVLVFPCDDRHAICLECFQIYCTTKLNGRDFIHSQTDGYTLSCPASCENSCISEVHHFRALGDYQYDRYQRFGAEECVLHSGGVLCPAPGCGAGILPEGIDTKIQCPECNFLFCRNCKESYHTGECEISPNHDADQARNSYEVDRERWEEASKDVIQTTTKPCPKCKAPTEKDGGCMHMTCSRCHFDWCWQCNIEWNRDCQGNHWFD